MPAESLSPSYPEPGLDTKNCLKWSSTRTEAHTLSKGRAKRQHQPEAMRTSPSTCSVTAYSPTHGKLAKATMATFSVFFSQIHYYLTQELVKWLYHIYPQIWRIRLVNIWSLIEKIVKYSLKNTNIKSPGIIY